MKKIPHCTAKGLYDLRVNITVQMEWNNECDW